MIAFELSRLAYCGVDSYMTQEYNGVLEGFVPSQVIYSGLFDDTEGFIGYLPSAFSIFVVFRGSHSIQNWITDLKVLKTEYASYPEWNAEVHTGWFEAEQNVIHDVRNEVLRLKGLFPGYQVRTTGHSLGAALALLTQLDLLKAGIYTTMINFGQPRVGDANFALKVSGLTPGSYRVTHALDVVPHVPFESLGYKHQCTEVYENSKGQIKVCSSKDCEDKTCSQQNTLTSLNGTDHLCHFGKCLGTTCGYCDAPTKKTKLLAFSKKIGSSKSDPNHSE